MQLFCVLYVLQDTIALMMIYIHVGLELINLLKGKLVASNVYQEPITQVLDLFLHQHACNVELDNTQKQEVVLAHFALVDINILVWPEHY